MATYYIPVDSTTIAVDSDHFTIEGADRNVPAIKNRPIHTNDYLGVGTSLYHR